MNGEPVLTLDLDWAPDFAIEDAARTLIDRRVRATWFVTHETPVLALLRAHPDLFELGIHPNFLPGSSHGASPAEVLAHCMAIVPEARSVRTHALVQSTPILTEIVARTPVRTDVSLLQPRVAGLQAFVLPLGPARLLRLPYCWEDDVEMDWARPAFALDDLPPAGGLRILDFHPIHVALNSASMAPYGALKRRRPRLQDATRDDCEALAAAGAGTGSFFRAVAERLAGRESMRVCDLSDRWAVAA